jgi:hypothetical protein
MSYSEPVIDERGTVMFHCALCGGPIAKQDFFDLALRLPDRDEDRDDYCDAELIDELRHPSCVAARVAG